MAAQQIGGAIRRESRCNSPQIAPRTTAPDTPSSPGTDLSCVSPRSAFRLPNQINFAPDLNACAIVSPLVPQLNHCPKDLKAVDAIMTGVTYASVLGAIACGIFLLASCVGAAAIAVVLVIAGGLVGYLNFNEQKVPQPASVDVTSHASIEAIEVARRHSKHGSTTDKSTYDPAMHAFAQSQATEFLARANALLLSCEETEQLSPETLCEQQSLRECSEAWQILALLARPFKGENMLHR